MYTTVNGQGSAPEKGTKCSVIKIFSNPPAACQCFQQSCCCSGVNPHGV